MKTLEQIKQAYTSGALKGCFPDERNIARLLDFFPASEWAVFGFKLAEGAEPDEPKAFTEEAVKEQLASDLAFAFEKAHDERGISSAAMYSVIKTWMWVLEDDLADFDGYGPYGLPLYERVAQKYSLPVPA